MVFFPFGKDYGDLEMDAQAAKQDAINDAETNMIQTIHF